MLGFDAHLEPYSTDTAPGSTESVFSLETEAKSAAFQKSMPKVSVCVPTYNGAPYLRECLDSVLGQTFDDMEILVVDDGSTDESVSIAEEYMRSDKRVCLFVNEKNLGLVANWNRCVDLSTGKWIKFVLQDDSIEPECLAKMIDMSSGPSPLRVCGRRFLFDGVEEDVEKLFDSFRTTWSLDKIFPGRRDISAKSFCEAVRKHGTVNFIGEPTAVLIHREIFRKFGGFNPNFVQLCDLEYWLRVGVQTGLNYIPETLATFRVHHGSATSKGRSSAYFRTNVIDPLILTYEFAHNPLFKPLRKGRLGCHALMIRRKLAEAAYAARRTAERTAGDSSTSLVDWNNAVKQYPLLQRAGYSHFIMVRERLNRYFWRFRRAAS